ncbi:MAG: type I DNA topoisomerase [Gloeocapsa sp. UFS-A4-WI-NPMV-4B04]|jgi:DNA topoisomerase-1|nr:type I DNA topoisomerase [Gloeocapsa sp. UFS-A4-WI-NPMV-4B04]
MKLLLIESGGKIKKLKQILGSEWTVKATMGHVVELAESGENSLGFTLDTERNRIDCNYVPRGTRGKQILKELREAVKAASLIVLATDADREGETIAWHLVQQLKLKNPQRAVYTEITEKAVRQAISHTRPIDMNLVAAGRCRSVADKLVGFMGSPLLWKLGNGAKSMGRVQSAALHILCIREREILAFVPQDYWSVYVDYAEGFRAYYAATAVSPDVKEKGADTSDDATDPKEKQVESVRVLSQNQADQLVAQAQSNPHHVVRVDATTTTRRPPAPFMTSSLQQAAGSRLKYGSEKTMKLAQSLYESGHITYMRTDSVTLSEDFCLDTRQWLLNHDPQNVPERVATQKSSSGAQEAHEAIRPTHVNNTPDSLRAKLAEDEAKLYSLIWGRAIASQCKNAQLQKTRIVTQSGTAFWQARGQVVAFRGYTRYWNDLSKDSQLPTLQQQQKLTLEDSGSEKKQTQPPPRYTEPKLVQVMEKKGIGRPSTYAPTVKVLRERNYASLLKGCLQPTQLGMEVDEFLGKTLPKMIQPEFTAEMEAQLDVIALGKQNWEKYLINWNETYFAPALKAAYQSLGVTPGGASRKSRSSSSGSKQAALTEIHCLKCEWLMQKISCHSEKLQSDHFLKCSNSSCGAAMFWSDKQQGYELPYSNTQSSGQNSNSPNRRTNKTLTKTSATKTRRAQNTDGTSYQESSNPQAATTIQYPCPVCAQPLEIYEYKKGNELKQMLRCSDPLKRKEDDHKQAVYFASKGVFWSPLHGEIVKSNSHEQVASSAKSNQPSRPVNNTSTSVSKNAKDSETITSLPVPNLTEHLCPVCQKPLELYNYTKGNEPHQMLRCSDASVRREVDHKDVAFFASRGVFWSPKYGEAGSQTKTANDAF